MPKLIACDNIYARIKVEFYIFFINGDSNAKELIDVNSVIAFGRKCVVPIF